MNSIDLNNPPPNHSYQVRVEREETRAERGVRLFKDLSLFLVGIAFTGILMWLCIDAVRSPASSPEEQKWAMSVLSAAAGGVIGYLVRR